VILALGGGVGAAKFANSLAQRVAPQDLVVVASTSDDLCHVGLRIAPDLDMMMYASAIRSSTQSWSWRTKAGSSWMVAGGRSGSDDTYRAHAPPKRRREAVGGDHRPVLVINERDRRLRRETVATGLRVSVADTSMKGAQDQQWVAQTGLEFVASIASARENRMVA